MFSSNRPADDKQSLLNPILEHDDVESSGANPPSAGAAGAPAASPLQRNDTFSGTPGGGNRLNSTEGLQRKVTFEAHQTSTPQSQPRRTSSGRFTFDGMLQRSLTEMSNVFDPDGQFTKAVIDGYVQHAEDAQEGEMPLPTGFARKARFWKTTFLACCLAVVIAVAAAAFVNMIDEMPKKWATCDYDNDSSCGDWYTGKKWWMLLTGGAGLTVGLIRWAISYPRNLPGVFKEVEEMHVHPKWSAAVYLLSMISLCCGATVGPEQALGNAAGGMATFLTEHLDDWWFEGVEYKQLLVLSAMSCAFSALFGTPILGTLMLHELGDPPLSFMESTTMFSLSSIVCFAVYYCMVTNTYIDHASDSSLKISIAWLNDGGYKNWMVVTSALIGVAGAGINFLCTVSIGIFKQVFNRIRNKCVNYPILAEVLPPLIGGISIGAVNWALPATVGNGSMLFTFFIKYGVDESFTRKQLLCTGFARIFLFGVSTQCGFIGGVIFPLLTIGMIAGVLTYRYFDFLDPYFCIATMMTAVPMGVMPMPFSFSCLVIFLFFFGFYQTVPIFIAGLVSYTVICGSGLFKKMALVSAAKARKEAAEMARQKAIRDGGSAASTNGSSTAGGGSSGTGSGADGDSSSERLSRVDKAALQMAADKREADDFAIKAYSAANGKKVRLVSEDDENDDVAER